VDFLHKTLRVDQQLVRMKPNRLVLGPPKTAASYRTIPMPQSVLDVLASHLAERLPAQELTPPTGRPRRQYGTTTPAS
jgi:hypothetical protein